MASADRPRNRRVLFLLLFFLSGISGLIYESIWSRSIKQYVGSAALAQMLTLALFMGGMSLGALLAARLIVRIRRAVFAYGVIEGAVGLYALAFPWLFQSLLAFSYDVLFPALGAGNAVTVLRWLLAALLILPPCVLLGMTFPLMSVGILRAEPQRSGEILSGLYFSNSLGAALGAMLSGFVFVGAFGLAGTLAIGAALNFAIMFAALALGRKPEPLPPELSQPTPTDAQDLKLPLFLAVAFGTGLSSFIYEISWVRLLSMIIGSATHSFEVMLSAFILGLALGGLWARGRLDRFHRPVLALAVIQILMGLSAVLTLPLYSSATDILSWFLDVENPTERGWLTFNVVRYFLCLLMMFPATFLAGTTLPLVTHLLLRKGAGESAVGRVYGWNTLGAIVGATSTGLLLLPLIGLKWALILGGVVDVGLGLALIRGAHSARELKPDRSHPEFTRLAGPAAPFHLLRAGILAGLIMIAGGLVFSLDPAVLTAATFRLGRSRQPLQNDILSFVHGCTASVAVVEMDRHHQERVIYTNGKPDASVVRVRYSPYSKYELGPRLSGDEPNQILLGAYPLFFKPEATDVALIGFGSGMTVHTLLASPRIERLDTIEIEPEMIRQSRYFYPANARAYDDRRSHLHYDDAKAFFASQQRLYDILISEPTNPWVSGVSSLFTVEFYQRAKASLKPGGIFGQWVQIYELSDELLLTMLAALEREFVDYQVFQVGYADWMILASADGELPELQAKPFAWEEMRRQLAILGVRTKEDLLTLRSANRELLGPFFAQQTPNRDSHPILDTGAERARFFREKGEFFFHFRRSPVPFLSLVVEGDRPPFERRKHLLHDPNLLREHVQAQMLLTAASKEPGEIPKRVDVDLANRWRAMTAALRKQLNEGRVDEATKKEWQGATLEMFSLTNPYVQIVESSFWQDARELARQIHCDRCVLEMELLNAVARRSPQDALSLSRRLLDDERSQISRRLREQIHAWVLLGTGATLAERKKFLDGHLQELPVQDNQHYFVVALRDLTRRGVKN